MVLLWEERIPIPLYEALEGWDPPTWRRRVADSNPVMTLMSSIVRRNVELLHSPRLTEVI
jgi:hypothetical protein